MQDCLELKEQLNEYKGLAHQLTEEKALINEQLDMLRDQLHTAQSQINQSDHIINSLNSQL